MRFIKNIAVYLYKKPSIVFFIVLIGLTIDRGNRWKDWDEQLGPFTSDVQEYYSFLPYHLLDNHDSVIIHNLQLNKRTIGMAIMYSPFFTIGHIETKLSKQKADGFSPAYQKWVHIGTLLYVFFALIITRKTLLLFFKEPVTILSLIIVVFATNLFYYSYSWGEMPHSYLFFLYSAFIYNSIKWLANNKKINIFLLSFILGFITLIRPTDFLLILFPIFFKINGLSDIFKRIKNLIQDFKTLGIALFLFFFPVLLQLIYWKTTQGKWIIHAYESERFFFFDPQIINFLFSYRKGWLVYTPIMSLSIIGAFMSYKRLPEFFWVVLLYTVLSIYFLSCWWDWSYGGSFGCRALIQSYALLIFPLAVCIDFIWNLSSSLVTKSIYRIILLLVISFFCNLNILESGQYKYSIIHWSGMTKQTYWYIFRDENVTREKMNSLEKMFQPPNYHDYINGKRDK